MDWILAGSDDRLRAAGAEGLLDFNDSSPLPGHQQRELRSAMISLGGALPEAFIAMRIKTRNFMPTTSLTARERFLSLRLCRAEFSASSADIGPGWICDRRDTLCVESSEQPHDPTARCPPSLEGVVCPRQIRKFMRTDSGGRWSESACDVS